MQSNQEITKEIVLKLIEHGHVTTILESTEAFRKIFATVIKSENVELSDKKLSIHEYYLNL